MADPRLTVEKEADTILRICEDPAIVAQALQALAMVALARSLDGIGQTLDQLTRNGRLQADLRLENQNDSVLRVDGDIRTETA